MSKIISIIFIIIISLEFYRCHFFRFIALAFLNVTYITKGSKGFRFQLGIYFAIFNYSSLNYTLRILNVTLQFGAGSDSNA